MINIKKLSILLAIFFVIGCSLTSISANNDMSDNIAINEDNSDNLEQVSTASNFTTLQQDIYNNSEIVLSNNVTMSEYENNTFTNGMTINKTITIDGQGHIIDANNSARIFNIGTNGTLTLKNTILINGFSENFGSAIFNLNGTSVLISNCTFINNEASNNTCAVIYNKFGFNFTVYDCTFINNTLERGGAITNNQGENFTVSNCIFINNTSNYGSITNNGGLNMNINSCTFIDNKAKKGGSIYIYGGYVSIKDSTSKNNLNTSDIYISDGVVSLNNNSFNSSKSTPNILLKSGIISSHVLANIMNNETIILNKNDNCTIKVTFKDDLGNLIAIINNTYVTINDLDYNLTNNGSYSYYDYTANIPGKYNIGVNSTCLTDLEVKNATLIVNEGINLALENLTKYYGESSKLIATLTNNSKGLNNQTITFLINGFKYNRTTNENGTSAISINLIPGTYEVLASYNNTYISNSTVKVLTTIESSNLVKYYRNNSQYYAKFFDLNGNPLNNSKIQFNINGVIYNKTTNNSGVASLNINLQPKNYIITATNLLNNESTGYNITVLSIIVENYDLEKYYKNNSQYTVKILNGEGKTVCKGIQVTFNINGVLYNRSTDDNGIATLSINLDCGLYIITASYNGMAVSNLIKVKSIVVAKDITMKYQDGMNFTATALNGEGNPLSGVTITFNVNGVMYNKITDENGVARLAINLEPNAYIITSSYNGCAVANTILVNSIEESSASNGCNSRVVNNYKITQSELSSIVSNTIGCTGYYVGTPSLIGDYWIVPISDSTGKFVDTMSVNKYTGSVGRG